jgi:hypothetical protein
MPGVGFAVAIIKHPSGYCQAWPNIPVTEVLEVMVLSANFGAEYFAAEHDLSGVKS